MPASGSRILRSAPMRCGAHLPFLATLHLLPYSSVSTTSTRHTHQGPLGTWDKARSEGYSGGAGRMDLPKRNETQAAFNSLWDGICFGSGASSTWLAPFSLPLPP